jgi:hypothetical protein
LRISAQADAPSNIAFAPVCESPQKSIKYLACSLPVPVRKSRMSFPVNGQIGAELQRVVREHLAMQWLCAW